MNFIKLSPISAKYGFQMLPTSNQSHIKCDPEIIYVSSYKTSEGGGRARACSRRRVLAICLHFYFFRDGNNTEKLIKIIMKSD